MKIFLDDIRPLPNDKYLLSRTYEQCLSLIQQASSISEISLDYDLGINSTHTGYDVLLYLKKNNIKPDHINIHSTHYSGAWKMLEYAKEHFSESNITNNHVPMR